MPKVTQYMKSYNAEFWAEYYRKNKAEIAVRKAFHYRANKAAISSKQSTYYEANKAQIAKKKIIIIH